MSFCYLNRSDTGIMNKTGSVLSRISHDVWNIAGFVWTYLLGYFEALDFGELVVLRVFLSLVDLLLKCIISLVWEAAFEAVDGKRVQSDVWTPRRPIGTIVSLAASIFGISGRL